MTDEHPLRRLLIDAARGRYPAPDGSIVCTPRAPGPVTAAVVAFTAHTAIAADLPEAEILAHLPSDDLGAPMDARFLTWLAGELGARPGVHDLLLVGTRNGDDAGIELVPVDDAVDHPRVNASGYREDIRVYTDPDHHAVVVLGRGLARRWEIGIDVDASYRGTGLGRLLIRAAAELVGPEPLYAKIAAGNAASIRAFLAAGYRPIGSEIFFWPTAASG